MTRTRVLALTFGVIFGFLLQKGGVAKYHVLMGALLLQDFTVFKVMLSAIAVGSVGVFTLHRFGLLELHVKPTRWGPNLFGGLVFGAGFALLGYCPGTEAAAIGQENLDALVGAAGMVAGSWLFAEASGAVFESPAWRNAKTFTLADAVRMRTPVFPALFVPLLAGALVVLELATVR